MIRTVTFTHFFRRAFSNAVFTFNDTVHAKYTDTFQFWILEQFKNNSNYITHKVNELSEIQLRNMNCKLRVLNNNEILDFMLNNSNRINQALRKQLDSELKFRVNVGASLDELLSIVDTCIRCCTTSVAEMAAYKEALMKLEKLIATTDMTLHHKLQCMYYASISKKSGEAKKLMKVSLIKITPDSLKALKDDELGIFCNSLYRSAVMMPQQFLAYIVNCLKLRLSSFLFQPAIFICLIKCLRHARYYDDDFFDLMSTTIQNKVQEFKLGARIHLLAYYSDALHNNTDLVSEFINTSLNDIDQLINMDEYIRMKDINRLLWSASNYNIESVKAKLNKSSVAKYIHSLGISKFKNKPEEIINTLLWLWILEYNKREDLCCFITENNIKKIKGTNNFKHIAKLYLLLTCIAIEVPHLLERKLYLQRDNRLMPRIHKYLSSRPKLNAVLKLLKQNSSKLNLSEVLCEFKIPSLYIGGITAKTSRGIISIEVLDETLCLKGSCTPHGRMQLKMRLLKAQKIPTYTVNCITTNTNNINWENLKDLENWILSYI